MDTTIASTTQTDTTERHQFTTAEAVKFIRRQPTGTRFAVTIMGDAPIEGDPGRVFRDALSSYVNISRPEALRIASRFLSAGLEERGARIPVRLTTFFSESLGKRATVWLG